MPSVAPRWHTALFALVVIAVAITGTWLTWSSPSAPSQVPVASANGRIVGLYLPMILMQWGSLVYVCRVGRSSNALPFLLGAPWRDGARVMGDIALAALAFAFVVGLEIAWMRIAATGQAASAVTVLPHSSKERAAWVLVALSAGFCEEVVYRGYLRVQLEAFFGRPLLAIVGQAVLFSVAHADQGVGTMARFACIAFVLGAIALVRKSLWPTIVCHVAIDLVSGLGAG